MTPTVRTLALLLLILSARAADASYVPRQICVTLEAGFTIEEFNHRWGTATLLSLPGHPLHLVSVPGNPNIEQLAALMTQDPAVRVAEANYYLQSPEAVRQMVVGVVGGTLGDFEDQEITVRIGLAEAHERTRGAGMTIAILDTGVDTDHPLFEGRLSQDGYDFVAGDADPREEANGLDDDQDGWVDEGYGHGTMVAGIALLVAPEASILPIRVLDDEGRGDFFRIAQGLAHARQRGAQIVNMSFGVPLNLGSLANLLTVFDEGVLLAAAAGNENRETPPYYPAYFSRVCMITAVDSVDVKADFADYNAKVLVSAPGVGVRSAYPGETWGIGAGCSFAAPFVSGEMALAWSLFPGESRDVIEGRIAAGVDSIDGLTGNEIYAGKLGTGRIYIPRALTETASVGTGGASWRPWRAHPNPSGGAFRIERRVGAPGIDASAQVVSITGRVLRSLAVDERGFFEWDSTDSEGRPVPAGIYFARIRWTGGDCTLPLIRVR